MGYKTDLHIAEARLLEQGFSVWFFDVCWSTTNTELDVNLSFYCSFGEWINRFMSGVGSMPSSAE